MESASWLSELVYEELKKEAIKKHLEIEKFLISGAFMNDLVLVENINFYKGWRIG